MATRVFDYRFEPFQNVPEPVQITDELCTIPQNSPYTIRLNEVPQKTTPSTIMLTFEDGTPLVEVSAMPSEGQYYPDYYTKADGDDAWNTGTILFNAADKGKKIKASYLGMGTLVDSRNSGANWQIFSTSGIHQFVVPAFVRELKVTCIGGAGGGGGGCQGAGGGNGSTGYYNQKVISVLPNTNYTVTIGAGGAAGYAVWEFSYSPYGTAGGTGGVSSFGNLLSASGGGGGGGAYRYNAGDDWAYGYGGSPSATFAGRYGLYQEYSVGGAGAGVRGNGTAGTAGAVIIEW